MGKSQYIYKIICQDNQNYHLIENPFAIVYVTYLTKY